MKEPVREKFLVFGAPQIEDAEINEVVDSLRSSWLGTDPEVAKFEEMVRDRRDLSVREGLWRYERSARDIFPYWGFGNGVSRSK
jgi:hypothetical protein